MPSVYYVAPDPSPHDSSLVETVRGLKTNIVEVQSDIGRIFTAIDNLDDSRMIPDAPLVPSTPLVLPASAAPRIYVIERPDLAELWQQFLSSLPSNVRNP